ncbi:MAG: glycosyltransferase [Planctomycetes bacterium]|nr:glycosyltransferase [Planctomycetota bacterium]
MTNAPGIGSPTIRKDTPSAAARSVEVMRNPTLRADSLRGPLPRITIVTPCRDHGEFLEAALVSVLEQGYPNLEYIVMDGGSRDGSDALIVRYERYLTHWQSAPDAGPYHAIQAGFARSTGEIMGWLNADDMLQRNSLWSVADLFSQLPQVEWITGTPMLYDPFGRTYVPRCRNRWSRMRFLRGDYRFIQQESTLWRRSLWERAGARLETRYRLAADMELWMRFFRHAPLYTAEILVGGFRKRDESLSRSQMREYLTEAEQILAAEPRSKHDVEQMRKFRLYDRIWRRLPIARKSWRVRHGYQRLFEYPPAVAYDDRTGRFAMREQTP